MYLDITDMLGANRKFIRTTNPTTALYFSLILDILKQVKLKSKFDPATGEFTLDRKYIERELCIDKKEQYNCDSQLEKLGIVKIDESDPDKLAVNMNRYFSLLADETLSAETILGKTVKMTRAQKKESKEAGIVSMLVKQFNEDDPDVRSKLTTLVYMYYRRGVCTKYQWQPVIELISKTATTKETKIELIDYVILKNWQSIGAAIEDYKQKHKATGTRINAGTKVCNKVKSDIEF